MNNEQFRRLLADQSSKPKVQNATPSRDAAQGGTTPGGSLGSRMRSSIPMTPRSVTGVDFARQLFEQRQQGDRPSKRFKSSAAPKGTALPSGYQDRAQLRNAEGEAASSADIEKRIKALEEMVKLGQLDQATFDNLRRELGVGGDISSTHMVKGLDMDLLRRVRAGEDVSKAAERPAPPPEKADDADEEFERLMEEKALEEIAAAPKQPKEKKKGTMAPPPMKPKTRDEILRELKASRAAAAMPAPPPESTLGSKFKKLSSGQPEKKRFVERDETGRRREVLLITDAQGNTKRKTRWLDKPVEAPAPAAGDLLMPDKSAKPLGMDVPAELAARAAPEPEDDDEDIFAGVGDDYNPLAGLEDDGSSSDEDDELVDPAARKTEMALVNEEESKPAAADTAPAKPRNYFATGTSDAAEETPVDRSNPLTKDPTILAALKRAAALRQASPSAEGDEGESSEKVLRHKRFLEEARRREAMDAADMDMGFGGSRNEDGEEEDEGALLDFDGERGGKKRKRGPKKKKGDKDSAADIMRVVEGRKKQAP